MNRHSKFFETWERSTNHQCLKDDGRMSDNRCHPCYQSLAVCFLLVMSFAMAGDDKPAEKVPGFSEHLIKGDYSYSYGLDAADLDGDGDLDITSSDTRNFKLYWFENSGQGKFKEHLIEDGDRLGILGDITGDAITNSAQGDATNNRWFLTPRLERHMIGDVNADGKSDVVIVENLHGDVYWYKNSGTPAKDPV